MSYTREEKVINGRTFALDIDSVRDQNDRELWLASVTVVGRETLKGGSWSVGPCLSEGEARLRAVETMRQWKS
jgi:hypothetical protein